MFLCVPNLVNFLFYIFVTGDDKLEICFKFTVYFYNLIFLVTPELGTGVF